MAWSCSAFIEIAIFSTALGRNIKQCEYRHTFDSDGLRDPDPCSIDVEVGFGMEMILEVNKFPGIIGPRTTIYQFGKWYYKIHCRNCCWRTARDTVRIGKKLYIFGYVMKGEGFKKIGRYFQHHIQDPKICDIPFFAIYL